MKPFALLTYAIVALVIVGLAITLMLQFFPTENVFDKLKDGLEFSQTTSNLGIAHYTGNLQMNKDLVITKDALNEDDISLAVECNDPKICCSNGEKCSKSIEWTYEKIYFKVSESISTYTRCNTYFNELVCRVYFGKMPAQAKIESVDYVDNGGKINTIVKVTNVGNSELTLGQNSLKVLKKIGEEWVDTQNEYPIKEINLLTPGQEHSFVWETELMSGGEYQLEFLFEGNNSGYDRDGFDLIVGQNKECKRDEDKIEIQDLNTTHLRVVRFCEECNFGYECLAKWIEKNDGNTYEPYQTNSTFYIEKISEEELCKKELGETNGFYHTELIECPIAYTPLDVDGMNSGICCMDVA